MSRRGKNNFKEENKRKPRYNSKNNVKRKSSTKNKRIPQKENADKKSKKKMNKALKIVLIVLISLLAVVASIFGTYLYKSNGNIKNAIFNIYKDVVGDQDPIFVLILGVSEDISTELTDTIMLAGYNPDNNQAFLVSIPRDTFVGTNEAKAGGFDKINALYQKDPKKTVEAVENLTGVKIDYCVTVKTSALVDIVNDIGGVEFDVPINMDYDDPTQDLHIHLKAGWQKLNGDQAEQLVRFRHNNNGTTYSASYGDNDQGRMRTQREFIKVVAKKVISNKNIDQLKKVATTVFKNLKTDISLNTILNYVPYVINFNIDNLEAEQLPGTPKMMNDLWFYKADSAKTKNLINEYVDKLGLTDEEKKQHLIPQRVTTTSTSNTTKSNITKSTTTKSNTSKNETNKAKNNVKNTTANKTENTETKKNTIENTNKNVNVINKVQESNIIKEDNNITNIENNSVKEEKNLVNIDIDENVDKEN